MYNRSLHFHFTGIGGAGMAGIAEILVDLGFRVSGSDLSFTPVCERLVGLGAEVFRGHAAKNLPSGCSLVVYSSAVHPDNPELVEARRRGLPVIRRAEVLAELMRLKFGVAVAGSHGKTTTTSLIGAVLEAGGLDPTVIIGGQVRSSGTGAKLGKSEFLVAESDESDRSFLLLKPAIAVVTNIDAEHLVAYRSLSELEQSFGQFVQAVPFYGLAVLCIDDRRVRELADRYQGRKITYGLSPDADIQARSVSCELGVCSAEVSLRGQILGNIELPMPGQHFLINSLAAVAVGLELGVAFDKIQSALRGFSGVKRRLELLGVIKGITVIDDYGHHPTEIKASIRAVRDGWRGRLNRLHVIFQPHRYTRTRDCFVEYLDAFTECDSVVITDIYATGEDPIPEISSEKLADALVHPKATYVSDLSHVIPALLPVLEPKDVVICLGAGSIGGLASKILAELEVRSDAGQDHSEVVVM